MIVLIGESGCGKSTVGNYLINNYNYEKIVSYTTRPIRKGEKDNVDYHFITNEKFNELKRNNFFINKETGTVASHNYTGYTSVYILTLTIIVVWWNYFTCIDKRTPRLQSLI